MAFPYFDRKGVAISEKSLVDTSDFHHRADVELFRALKLSVARENEYSPTYTVAPSTINQSAVQNLVSYPLFDVKM